MEGGSVDASLRPKVTYVCSELISITQNLVIFITQKIARPIGSSLKS